MNRGSPRRPAPARRAVRGRGRGAAQRGRTERVLAKGQPMHMSPRKAATQQERVRAPETVGDVSGRDAGAREAMNTRETQARAVESKEVATTDPPEGYDGSLQETEKRMMPHSIGTSEGVSAEQSLASVGIFAEEEYKSLATVEQEHSTSAMHNCEPLSQSEEALKESDNDCHNRSEELTSVVTKREFSPVTTEAIASGEALIGDSPRVAPPRRSVVAPPPAPTEAAPEPPAFVRAESAPLIARKKVPPHSGDGHPMPLPSRPPRRELSRNKSEEQLRGVIASPRAMERGVDSSPPPDALESASSERVASAEECSGYDGEEGVGERTTWRCVPAWLRK